MQLSHSGRVVSAPFDDSNLVSSAGLVPVMMLARKTRLGQLAGERLTVPGHLGANAGLKVTAFVAGMVAGADSIDDIALLRHGGLPKLFTGAYAPSTLGSFLRKFAFGNLRQLDGVAARCLQNVAAQTPLLNGIGEVALVDIGDTIKEVHGYQKQGPGHGYSDILATVARLRIQNPSGQVLLRADSAFYFHAVVTAAVRAHADVSITARMGPNVKRAIQTIHETAWTTIEYTDAIWDEEAGRWVSTAEVAEVPLTAFTSKKKTDQVVCRLVVRRIPELNKNAADGHEPSSTRTGSTRSSPPAPWTPSPLIRHTVATQSSSRSTPI